MSRPGPSRADPCGAQPLGCRELAAPAQSVCVRAEASQPGRAAGCDRVSEHGVLEGDGERGRVVLRVVRRISALRRLRAY